MEDSRIFNASIWTLLRPNYSSDLLQEAILVQPKRRSLRSKEEEEEEECFTLSTILLSEVGVRPTHRANLQGSPSTCSVTPNSDVCKEE